MKLIENKKSVSVIAALLILIFHLWIPVTGSNTENFLRQISYIGVDIFFFLSGLSLVKPIISRKAFYLNRFKNVYLKFAFFAVFAAILETWPLKKLFFVLSGSELFTKGGGSFLWFIPGILLLYLIFPFYQYFDLKNRKMTLIVTAISWFAFGMLVTKFTGYDKIFILYMRIPIFLLGYYFGLNADKIGKQKNTIGFLLTAAGFLLIYLFGFQNKPDSPIYDIFYLSAVPLSIGTALLADNINSSKWIEKLGNSTLELYALQMIIGYKLAAWIFKSFHQPFLTNLLGFFILSALAVLMNVLLSKILNKQRNSNPRTAE